MYTHNNYAHRVALMNVGAPTLGKEQKIDDVTEQDQLY